MWMKSLPETKVINATICTMAGGMVGALTLGNGIRDFYHMKVLRSYSFAAYYTSRAARKTIRFKALLSKHIILD